MTPEVSQEQITVSESECYEITHIREKSGFAAGVLVAVSIPIFTAQLGKARRATNQANARAAYAAASAAYLGDDTVKGGTYTTADGKFVAEKTKALTAAASQDYTKSPTITSFTVIIGDDGVVSVSPKDNGTGATYNSGS